MKCIDAENIMDYLCGELPAAKRAEIQAHLSSCARCRRELETFERVRSAVASAPPARVSEDFTAALMRKLEDEKSAISPGPARVSFRALLRPAYGFSLAVLTVCLIIGAVFLKGKAGLPRPAAQAIFLSDGPAAANRGFYRTADIPLETGVDDRGGEPGRINTDDCKTADCGIL
ncbi:MAG: zf-HC2 domain-containing protein [Elusimicrobia bacterium]|nr:zf-HC2 domain-containing protein [Elusimicrobiota bacterium]